MSYQFGHPETKSIGTNGAGDLFAGKRCLITGASSGIGYGLAERLLQRGAAEVWLCSRNEERIRSAAEKLNAAYGRVRWRAVDVCDAEGLQGYLDDMALHGPIDYVFANAGVSAASAFEKTTRAEFDRVMEPNFYGVFNADQAALSHMLRQGRGHILNVSSMEGFFANGYHSAYIASKFAVMGLTEALRYEYAERNIQFSVICPGPVVSNIWGRDETGEIHPEYQA
ncbi:MAG: SDR family oxidoreductase, partial [Oscillospiraceae bacterium]|nr:SDR family oxidoreductase [Oscillospiraceae bacterium]